MIMDLVDLSDLCRWRWG